MIELSQYIGITCLKFKSNLYKRILDVRENFLNDYVHLKYPYKNPKELKFRIYLSKYLSSQIGKNAFGLDGNVKSIYQICDSDGKPIGSSSVVCVIESDSGKKYCLKTRREKIFILGEEEYFNQAKEAEVDVPSIISQGNISSLDCRYLLLEYIEIDDVRNELIRTDIDFKNKVSYELGVSIAKIHMQTKNLYPGYGHITLVKDQEFYGNRDKPIVIHNNLLEIIRNNELLDSDSLSKIEIMRDEIRKLTLENTVLLHRDLSFENMMFTKDRNILIDPNIEIGHPYIDIASFFFCSGFDNVSYEKFISGYQSIYGEIDRKLLKKFEIIVATNKLYGRYNNYLGDHDNQKYKEKLDNLCNKITQLISGIC